MKTAVNCCVSIGWKGLKLKRMMVNFQYDIEKLPTIPPTPQNTTNDINIMRTLASFDKGNSTSRLGYTCMYMAYIQWMHDLPYIRLLLHSWDHDFFVPCRLGLGYHRPQTTSFRGSGKRFGCVRRPAGIADGEGGVHR